MLVERRPNCIAHDALHSGVQGHGIAVAAGASDRYVIQGDLVSGNNVAGISDNGTGMNKMMHNNCSGASRLLHDEQDGSRHVAVDLQLEVHAARRHEGRDVVIEVCRVVPGVEVRAREAATL